jgi:hypothetical protein
LAKTQALPDPITRHIELNHLRTRAQADIASADSRSGMAHHRFVDCTKNGA